MKITAIRTHILKSELSEPFVFSQGWVSKRSATLVEVQTDTGPSGWGEAFATGLEAREISAAAIEHALAPLLIGKDPLDIEVLWHRMYHATLTLAAKVRFPKPSARSASRHLIPCESSVPLTTLFARCMTSMGLHIPDRIGDGWSIT